MAFIRLVASYPRNTGNQNRIDTMVNGGKDAWLSSGGRTKRDIVEA